MIREVKLRWENRWIIQERRGEEQMPCIMQLRRDEQTRSRWFRTEWKLDLHGPGNTVVWRTCVFSGRDPLGQGSPTTGPRTGTGLWPGPHSRRWAVGKKTKLHLPLPIAPHRSHYHLNYPLPLSPPPNPRLRYPWKNYLPPKWSLVPEGLGTAALEDRWVSTRFIISGLQVDLTNPRLEPCRRATCIRWWFYKSRCGFTILSVSWDVTLCRAWWLEGNLTGVSQVLECSDPWSGCWLPECDHLIKIHTTAHLCALFFYYLILLQQS